VETLRSNIPVAIAVSNEKVRSELLVAPVLMELKRAHPTSIGFFSASTSRPTRPPASPAPATSSSA